MAYVGKLWSFSYNVDIKKLIWDLYYQAKSFNFQLRFVNTRLLEIWSINFKYGL